MISRLELNRQFESVDRILVRTGGIHCDLPEHLGPREIKDGLFTWTPRYGFYGMIVYLVKKEMQNEGVSICYYVATPRRKHLRFYLMLIVGATQSHLILLKENQLPKDIQSQLGIS